ncbi:hypothetical protein NMY22_g283 [Coprinellus aureogranulatus]|nr:hypothetical protein NMY22_g283 [Coprinellus aureogranulatus]
MDPALHLHGGSRHWLEYTITWGLNLDPSSKLWLDLPLCPCPGSHGTPNHNLDFLGDKSRHLSACRVDSSVDEQLNTNQPTGTSPHDSGKMVACGEDRTTQSRNRCERKMVNAFDSLDIDAAHDKAHFCSYPPECPWIAPG